MQVIQSVVPIPSVFCFNSHEVRTFEKEGEVWFVGVDVAETLGYSKARNALATHCKGALKQGVPTSGGMQEMIVIPERDVYRLVMKSKLPAAEKFEEWVVGEVLPSIRRGGGYSLPSVPAVPQSLSEALRLAADLHDQKLALEHKVEVLEPKAEIADRISVADGSLCVTDAAKVLRVKPHFLFSFLETAKWVYRRIGSKGIIAYQKKIQDDLLEHKAVSVPCRDGSEMMQVQVRVTPRGLVKLAELVGGAA